MVNEIKWEGRLGVELIKEAQGCCIGEMLKWRPPYSGAQHECSNCGNRMKTIRAGEIVNPVFTGACNEAKAVDQPEMTIGSLYFGKNKFKTVDSVKDWMIERGMDSFDVQSPDQVVWRVEFAPLDNDTARYVWISQGVVGAVGIIERQVAAGAGQASGASPSIAMAGMGSGGAINPTQGNPPAYQKKVMGKIVQGVTKEQDGHQHEIALSPQIQPSGMWIRGFTSFNSGHAHMIEASLSGDGAVAAYTAPDQAPVGGHAHRHRFEYAP